MAAIKCTNCGAVLKPKDPIPPGKKVKCPKCQQPFIVQAEEEAEAPNDFAAMTQPSSPPPFGGDDDADAPPAKGKSGGKRNEIDDDGGDDDDDRGKGKGKGKGGDAPKKSNTMLIVGIVVGVLLLCCCCPGVGSIFVGPEIQKALEDAAKKQQLQKK